MSESHLFVMTGALVNILLAIGNVIMARRLRKMAAEQQAVLGRLLGFAGLMASPEFGAPEAVRDMARAALPPGAEVVVERVGRVH